MLLVRMCNMCNKQKPDEDFTRRGRIWKTCTSCVTRQAKYTKKWLAGQVDEEFDRRLKEQEGKCGICGKTAEEESRKFAVDHCHKTLKIRGLLCMSCNTGLGKFKDDPELLTKAIEWLCKE